MILSELGLSLSLLFSNHPSHYSAQLKVQSCSTGFASFMYIIIVEDEIGCVMTLLKLKRSICLAEIFSPHFTLLASTPNNDGAGTIVLRCTL